MTYFGFEHFTYSILHPVKDMQINNLLANKRVLAHCAYGRLSPTAMLSASRSTLRLSVDYVRSGSLITTARR
jgi:hypothetical protein